MTPLQTAPSALKIGVGIRAGDAVFNGHKVSVDFGDAYVDCALQIEAHWKKQNQPVIWYVMSESLELRSAIKENYGKERTIITDTSTVMQHINCKDYGQNACHPNVTADDALRMAAGQVWVFSATDIQVISKESGFARMGAFLSSRFHNIYSIDGIHAPGNPRRCGRTEYDTVEASAQHSSGIR
ncbi:hypothetical protein COCOBI_19-2360 [Coccomyxa sp. Obi]|nr:hypothetical protein COCOBI_19-2360 [Coccomyxa sp. Obi]